MNHLRGNFDFLCGPCDRFDNDCEHATAKSGLWMVLALPMFIGYSYYGPLDSEAFYEDFLAHAWEASAATTENECSGIMCEDDGWTDAGQVGKAMRQAFLLQLSSKKPCSANGSNATNKQWFS